ncbi:uncharacterized protein EI90DRAFT_3051777 [Cantharellus anzutake]|uniref:uncharacterized protein n=1 Tax=Cantharellus anzutake TaxID=1750568 RepID=UPI0019050754|nr:uncharacterized protein EI90DRAFT_3051777 [Cantharellus anzutake]KAF8334306.1 hypothetical protein EI90DRAFT_3051777 [Cantharellus anzutake]
MHVVSSPLQKPVGSMVKDKTKGIHRASVTEYQTRYKHFRISGLCQVRINAQPRLVRLRKLPRNGLGYLVHIPPGRLLRRDTLKLPQTPHYTLRKYVTESLVRHSHSHRRHLLRCSQTMKMKNRPNGLECDLSINDCMDGEIGPEKSDKDGKKSG